MCCSSIAWQKALLAMSRKDATFCFIFKICYITQLEFTETMFSLHSRPLRDTWKWIVGNEPSVFLFSLPFPKSALPLDFPICGKVTTISLLCKSKGSESTVRPFFSPPTPICSWPKVHTFFLRVTCLKHTYLLFCLLPHHSYNILPLPVVSHSLFISQLSWFTLPDLSFYIFPVINWLSTSCQNFKSLFYLKEKNLSLIPSSSPELMFIDALLGSDPVGSFPHRCSYSPDVLTFSFLSMLLACFT